MLMSAELWGCLMWFIYILDLLQLRYNFAKFHHCRICVTDFREGGPFCTPPILEQPRKCPSWIKLKIKIVMNVKISCYFSCYLCWNNQMLLYNLYTFTFKVGLSPLKKKYFTCFNESPLKIIKNGFYFVIKPLFALKIFKFLSLQFGNVGKNDLIREIKLTSKLMTSQPS